ncbi:MAG: hypothetical protein Q8P20_05055 [bacterium]|nr:hypothetical protein [bacterium]
MSTVTGVTDWGRSVALKAFFDAIGPERTNEKWIEYVNKKIITKDVAQQLHVLYNQEPNKQ